jgi:hypothetical protein
VKGTRAGSAYSPRRAQWPSVRPEVKVLLRNTVRRTVILVISLLCAVIIASAYAQRKCGADTELYALSFDCSTAKGVIAFMIFWKPTLLPFHLH